MDDYSVHGPELQAAMFADGHTPPEDEVVAFAYSAPPRVRRRSMIVRW